MRRRSDNTFEAPPVMGVIDEQSAVDAPLHRSQRVSNDSIDGTEGVEYTLCTTLLNQSTGASEYDEDGEREIRLNPTVVHAANTLLRLSRQQARFSEYHLRTCALILSLALL